MRLSAHNKEEIDESKRAETEKGETKNQQKDTRRYIVNIPYATATYIGDSKIDTMPEDEKYNYTSAILADKDNANYFIINHIYGLYSFMDWDDEQDVHTLVKWFDVSFILVENTDKTYTRLPLVPYISEFIIPFNMKTNMGDKFNDIIELIYDEEENSPFTTNKDTND